MLVFVDESGDAGRKTFAGSSPYFILATVVFRDRAEATRCDCGISDLRGEMGLSPHKEFHFNGDRDEIRKQFLRRVEQFDFFYGAIVLNKDGLTSPGFNIKESLYKYTVKLAFANIVDELRDATIVFDRCGGREFTSQLKAYLRRRINERDPANAGRHFKKIRSEKSHTNNLLQLADMVCGAVARSYSQKSRGRNVYRNIIRHKELRVQIWPRIV